MQTQLDETWLIALLLASTRILAWAMVAPPLATAGLPRTVKVVVSVALALAVVPALRTHVPAAETGPLVGALVVQVVLGAALGFLTRLVFTAVEAAGSLLDLVSGFTLATAYDPMTSAATSVFGRFQALLTTTLVFATDVHLVIIRGFLRTFTAVPLDSGFSLDRLGRELTHGATDLFVAALQIAGPIVVVLFLTDVALGVLTRIAPQLNAFSLGFPLKIGLTLLLAGTTFLVLPEVVVRLAETSSRLVSEVVS